MAKRQNGDEIRKARAIGTGVSVVQRHADRGFRAVRRSARGRAAPVVAPPLLKGDVVVEVSEGNGQVARACEDRGFKAKTWVPDGFAAAQALLLALRHFVRKQRLLAVIINFQQRIPVELLNSRVSLCQRVVRLAVPRRFPVLVCLPSASPLSHRLHHELKSMESVHTLRCAGCEFGAKWAQRLDIWSAGVEKHDLSRLENRCTGAQPSTFVAAVSAARFCPCRLFEGLC